MGTPGNATSLPIWMDQFDKHIALEYQLLQRSCHFLKHGAELQHPLKSEVSPAVNFWGIPALLGVLEQECGVAILITGMK